MNSKQLPKFLSAPVIEMVIGVEFEKLPKWDLRYFGLFWETIKNRFPGFSVKPPIDSNIERLDSPFNQEVQVKQFVIDDPNVRVWYESNSNRNLVQLQADRFTFNWRKAGDEDRYPHFDDSILPKFKELWTEYGQFVLRHELGEITIRQCEVIYVNHIEKGEGWQSWGDLDKVFNCWSNETNGTFLPKPETVTFDIKYRIPDEGGRLALSVRPVIRKLDGAELIQLTLTSRGKPKNNTDLIDWIRLGREWGVRGFEAITKPAMHTMWKKTQG